MNNPIIQRELIGMLRTRRSLALLVTVPAVVSMMVLLRWPSDGQADMTGKQAKQVLQLFGYGMMVALMLLSPVFPATTVVREKISGTLALLLNSPMSAFSIFTGKLFGVLGFILLMILLSLPAGMACFTMSGVSIEQVIKVYALLVLMSVQYATLSLLVSSYSNKTDAALRWTFFFVLLLVLISQGPHQFLQTLVSGWLASLVTWVRCLSPVPAMMSTLGHGSLGGTGAMLQVDLFGRYVLLACISIVIFSAWTIRRLNVHMLDQARSQGKITDERSSSVKAYRRLMYLWFFDPQRRSGMIHPLANPVMVKEFRTRRFGRSNWMLRMIAACLLISLGMMLATAVGAQQWSVSTMSALMVIFQMSVIILVAPSLSSGLISSEVESKGWQLLLATPLSPMRILVGKLMSAIFPLLLIVLAMLPAYLLLLKADDRQVVNVQAVLLTLLLTCALAVLLPAAISSLVSRTAAATATSYGVLLLLVAGTMFVWMLRDAPFSQAFVGRVLLVNPLAAALSLVGVGGFDPRVYPLLPLNWWITGGISVASLGVLVFRTWRLTRPS